MVSHPRRTARPATAVLIEITTKVVSRSGMPTVRKAIPILVTQMTPVRNDSPTAAIQSHQDVRRNPIAFSTPHPASTKRASAASGPTLARMKCSRDRILRGVLRDSPSYLVPEAALRRRGAEEDEPVGFRRCRARKVGKQSVREPLVDRFITGGAAENEVEALPWLKLRANPLREARLNTRQSRPSNRSFGGRDPLPCNSVRPVAVRDWPGMCPEEKVGQGACKNAY